MEKICNNCQKVHTEIPATARPQMDFEDVSVIAYYWECDCKSTMCKLVKPMVKTLSKIVKVGA